VKKKEFEYVQVIRSRRDRLDARPGCGSASVNILDQADALREFRDHAPSDVNFLADKLEDLYFKNEILKKKLADKKKKSKTAKKPKENAAAASGVAV